MVISEIRGYRVACKLPEAMRNAVSRFETRTALIVEIVTDEGVSGWGECSQAPDATWAFIETVLAGLLIGRDPRAWGRLWRGLSAARPGGDIAMMAVSALDMALWDLRGRLEGVPIATLLGGRLRDTVQPYASGPFLRLGDDPYKGFDDTVEGYLRAGFTAVKTRIGVTPRRDAAAMRGLHKRFGPELVLMADANKGYAPAAALDLVDRLDEAELLWIEEPIAADDFTGYVKLANKSRTPLAAGESLTVLPQFRDFLATNAVSVIQPDLYLCGGFTGALRILALAEAFAVPYVPHVWGTAINFYASLQLAAALPSWRLGDGLDLPMLEWDQSGNDLLAFADVPPIVRGAVTVPDGPGLGVPIAPSLFERFITRSWRVSA